MDNVKDLPSCEDCSKNYISIKTTSNGWTEPLEFDHMCDSCFKVFYNIED